MAAPQDPAAAAAAAACLERLTAQPPRTNADLAAAIGAAGDHAVDVRRLLLQAERGR